MDGLEDDLDGQAAVIKIDLLSSVGRATAGEFGVKAVPTTLVFDGSGRIVYRQTGLPDADAIRAVVGELVTP